MRDSLADDAVVNYQWIETICVEYPWYRGRSIVIGDAAHACPPLIAQGAAMCAEDAVVLAEMLTSGDGVDEVLPVHGAPLPAREDGARQLPPARRVGDPPRDPGADPGRIMGQTLHALVAPA